MHQDARFSFAIPFMSDTTSAEAQSTQKKSDVTQHTVELSHKE